MYVSSFVSHVIITHRYFSVGSAVGTSVGAFVGANVGRQVVSASMITLTKLRPGTRAPFEKYCQFKFESRGG